MKAIKVIRIENPVNGKGIFRNSSLIYQESKARGIKIEYYDNHSLMRGAHNIDGFVEHKHFCAYKSIRGLQSFVTKVELELFVEMGFEVLELTVTDYIIHNHQVVYTKESIIKSKDISAKVLKHEWKCEKIFKEEYLEVSR